MVSAGTGTCATICSNFPAVHISVCFCLNGSKLTDTMATTHLHAVQPPVPPPRAPSAVLLLGSGGREHAIAHALAQSPTLRKLFVAPGNAATLKLGSSKLEAQNVILPANADIVQFCKSNAIDLVVVGPEGPLADGIAGKLPRFLLPHLHTSCKIRCSADELADAGIACFGPSKAAAQLETSKAYCKSFFSRHNIPTARWQAFTDFAAAEKYILSSGHRVVVKASGLAAGKGA